MNRKNIQEICLVHKKGLCSQTKTLEVTLLACKKINSLNHLFSISVSTEDSDLKSCYVEKRRPSLSVRQS